MMISIEGMAGIESMPRRRYSRAYVSTAVASPPSTRLEAAVPLPEPQRHGCRQPAGGDA